MEDSKKHHYDIKEDDCKTSSKEVIQDRIHVGEMGGCQIDTEKPQLEEEIDEMSWVSASVILVTGVMLPTVDVYTDILFAINVLMFEAPDGCHVHWNNHVNHAQLDYGANRSKYAAAMLTPPFISWLFVTYQWFRYEMGAKQKILTVPFLLLQVYPQWRALQVLYHGKWKKQGGWQRLKEKWETEIGNLEPFLESVPQVYILLVIWSIDGQFGRCRVVAPNATQGYFSFILSKMTFFTSILTASIGISKFLKSGPCHFIRNDSCLMGYGTLSYILLLINVSSTLLSKGFVLYFYVDPILIPHNTRQLWHAVMTLNFIPQSIHGLATFYLTLGLRKATSTLIIFPALLLTPVFSFWTFGPISSKHRCIYKIKEPKIHLSYRLTWINSIFTSGMTGGFLAGWFEFRYFGIPIYNHQEWHLACTFVLISLLSLALIQFLSKFSCVCSTTFQENCLPMTPKVVYDTRTEEKDTI